MRKWLVRHSRNAWDWLCGYIFSSAELKAQVWSPVVCLSICLSVNFLHFHLLLKNHLVNFNPNLAQLKHLWVPFQGEIIKTFTQLACLYNCRWCQVYCSFVKIFSGKQFGPWASCKIFVYCGMIILIRRVHWSWITKFVLLVHGNIN